MNRDTSNVIESRNFEIDPEDANDVVEALKAAGFTKFIIVEDFHYLAEEVQRSMAVDLKVFHENSKLVFIIVGVWLEADRLTVFNGDLSGRISTINLDAWKSEELLEVAKKGQPLLNIIISDEVCIHAVEQCQGNVGLLQEVLYQICEQADVWKTKDEQKEVGTVEAVDTRLAAEANLKAETERVERLKLELELREAGRINAIGNQSILVTVERLAAALGLRIPEEMSDAARSLQIIMKVKAFAGTQFDAIATSSDVGLSAFVLELRHGLKRAAWIEIDPSNIGAIHQEQAVVGGAPFVKIHVDAIRDFKLLEAAKSLASALNEEGIAATVLETEIGIASENTIHILVGPKQRESSV